MSGDIFKNTSKENIKRTEKYDIITERAKDNNLTCKVIKENKKIYLYSKYYPKKNLINREIYDTDYIVLGLGLGYEVLEILNKTRGKVYVIDYDDSFYNIIKENEELSQILNNDRAEFLFGEEYKKVGCKYNFNLYIQEKITVLNKEFFNDVINFYKKSKKNCGGKKVICFNHPTIAKDCGEAFSNLGFDVYETELYDYKNIGELEDKLKEIGAEILFSVNYNIYISYAARDLNIYYISMTVDTPCYPLYYEKPDYGKEFIFVFERAVAEYLTRKGLKNIFHMPVAVNIKRIRKSVCRNNFISDVSFVGGLTLSEYRKHFLPELSEETIKEINSIIEKQSNYIDKYITRDLVTDELCERILNESKKEITDRNLIVHLSLREIMAYLIDREEIYMERARFAAEFEKKFDFKVYGNNEWKKYVNCYAGRAEHFTQMPDVFNRTKINLNIIRTCFESGLPMRVFDILGSCGFLLSNYKEELLEYFDDGKDIAVFHSIEEAAELTKFYLGRDELRYKMIERSYEKIKKFHSYEDRIKEMLKIAFN